MSTTLMDIITPEQFTKIPWKNGLGVTTELAISEHGTLAAFDWRLSIASVINDGAFSDFSGYWRQLILLRGAGIVLRHEPSTTAQLDQPLSMAEFDGGAKTYGTLLDGPITDFNVMTKVNSYTSQIHRCPNNETLTLPVSELCFVYSDTNIINFQWLNQVASKVPDIKQLPVQHLLKLTNLAAQQLQIQGQNMLVICINKVV